MNRAGGGPGGLPDEPEYDSRACNEELVGLAATHPARIDQGGVVHWWIG
eukprot:COSAG02_NODE_277_length_25939_cov_108.963971_7_plen_49_part_00